MAKLPALFEGKRFSDARGTITFNNKFDFSKIKRVYTIENQSTEFIRGWQGHKIEQRWFACMSGAFEIAVIKIDHFDELPDSPEIHKFKLDDHALTYLHIPGGCITAIKAISEKSKLLVLADYNLGEIQDEYRFPLETFNFV